MCNRGKSHKEVRVLQTSLLGEILGPMWKFVFCTDSASKHLRKPLQAHKCWQGIGALGLFLYKLLSQKENEEKPGRLHGCV